MNWEHRRTLAIETVLGFRAELDCISLPEGDCTSVAPASCNGAGWAPLFLGREKALLPGGDSCR